jgi:tritrans,polycis-undecaprenyl-diphosphate synthase [geranylgeranyl-diphosphate specific]
MLQSLLRSVGVYKVYERRLNSEIKKSAPPDHIGIILDGNRRWAVTNNIPVEFEHEQGADIAEKLLDWCHELHIRSITLYVFSTENLTRTPKEIQELFNVIEQRLSKLLTDERIDRYKVRVKAIGKMELLPQSIQDLMRRIEEKTAGYGDHYLNIALAYGGRMEITDMVKAIAQDVKKGTLSPEEITQSTIEQRLYTAYLPNPEPDLIIRTSGEERTSGFLLWQGAYSELVFTDVFWPDFRLIDLMRAIRTYQKRARRYGK